MRYGMHLRHDKAQECEETGQVKSKEYKPS